MTDKRRIFDLIRNHSFGILFSGTHRGPMGTHLPFTLNEREGENGCLYSHMALGNPRGRELVVFQGPHSYISPAWYEKEGTVSTWNNMAVHAYGPFQPVEGEGAKYPVLRIRDGTPLDDRSGKAMKRIQSFRIPIQRLEGKWKLNQHYPVDRQIAQLME